MCLTLIESTGGLFGTSEDGRSATVAVPLEDCRGKPANVQWRPAVTVALRLSADWARTSFAVIHDPGG
jgi:hypothetical protein